MVALICVSAGRGDDALVYRAVEIMHAPDGKVSERWAVVDDPAAVAASFRADGSRSRHRRGCAAITPGR